MQFNTMVCKRKMVSQLQIQTEEKTIVIINEEVQIQNKKGNGTYMTSNKLRLKNLNS